MPEKQIKNWLIIDWKKGSTRTRQTNPNTSRERRDTRTEAPAKPARPGTRVSRTTFDCATLSLLLDWRVTDSCPCSHPSSSTSMFSYALVNRLTAEVGSPNATRIMAYITEMPIEQSAPTTAPGPVDRANLRVSPIGWPALSTDASSVIVSEHLRKLVGSLSDHFGVAGRGILVETLAPTPERLPR